MDSLGGGLQTRENREKAVAEKLPWHRDMPGHSRTLFAVAVFAASTAGAQQGVLANPASSAAGELGGFRIESMTGFLNYSSNLADIHLIPSGSNQDGWGAGITAVVGYSRFGERSGLQITYTPSYMASLQRAGGRSDSHMLLINWQRKLTPMLTWTVSGSGNISWFDEAIFRPTTLASIVASPATLDDIASAMNSGESADMASAMVMTVPAGVDSPAGLLLYGSRMLTSAVQTGFNYSRSSRLTMRVSLAGSWTEALEDSSRESDTKPQYLLPRSTAATADIGFRYSLTPRTQIGADMSTARIFSDIEDSYASDANFFLSHTVGSRLFFQLHGGAGIITPVRQSIPIVRKPQLETGGGLGYKASTQTFLLSVDRSISDSYGFGAASSLSVAGTWNWKRPGSHWTATGDVGEQWLNGAAVHNFNSWRANVGISRNMGPHTAISMQYAYLSSSDLTGGGSALPSAHMARMTVTWLPVASATR
jgi:hypothetical protein